MYRYTEMLKIYILSSGQYLHIRFNLLSETIWKHILVSTYTCVTCIIGGFIDCAVLISIPLAIDSNELFYLLIPPAINFGGYFFMLIPLTVFFFLINSIIGTRKIMYLI